METTLDFLTCFCQYEGNAPILVWEIKHCLLELYEEFVDDVAYEVG